MIRLRVYVATALVVATFIKFAPDANACVDNWNFAQDKQKHFAGSVAMAALANGITDDPWKAFGISVAIGAGKEIYDINHHGCASYKDLGYDIMGSALGAYVGYKIKDWYFAPNRVVYFKEF